MVKFEFECIETFYMESSMQSAVIEWAKWKGYNPRLDLKCLNLLLTIKNQDFKVSNYKCCKDEMVLIDIEKIN